MREFRRVEKTLLNPFIVSSEATEREQRTRIAGATKSLGESSDFEVAPEDGCDREEKGNMRAGTPWRHLQQLGRAFTATPFNRASNDANLISSSFPSLRKPVEQLWKPKTTLAQSVDQERNLVIENLRSGFRRGHCKHVSISEQESGAQLNASTPNLSHRKLYSVNPNQDWKLQFRVTAVRTQGSTAHSREPEYWDTSETTSPLQFNEEGLAADQNRPVREREWDHDEDEDLTRDRKDGPGMKMSRDDGIEWGQQHVRVQEYENRQRASLSPNPPPQCQHDDVYIPVKACYISRSVDLKRLSEESFLGVTTSRNNLIIRFADRPADAEPTSKRPVQFSILYLSHPSPCALLPQLLKSMSLCFL